MMTRMLVFLIALHSSIVCAEETVHLVSTDLDITFANVSDEVGGEEGSFECCQDLCCSDSRLWTGRVGAVFLDRSRPDAGVLAFEVGGPPPVLVDAGDFDFSPRAGIEAGLIRHRIFCTEIDLEARFFSVDGWKASTPAVPTTFPAYNYATPFFFGSPGTSISGTYQSKLQSVELNLRKNFRDRNWLQLLVGVRYLQVDEGGLSLIETVGGGPFTASTDARNELIGAQMGADALILSRGRLSIETLVKAGVYHNSARNSTRVTAAGVPIVPGSSARSSGVAFLGELGLTGAYQLTDRLSVRGGYQWLWTAGIATAPKQVPVSDPIAGTATVDRTGSPYFSGAFVNLEYVR